MSKPTDNRGPTRPMPFLYQPWVAPETEQKQGVAITGIWLRQEQLGAAVVLVEIGGKWIEIIRETEGGPYSHICEPAGIDAAIARAARSNPNV